MSEIINYDYVHNVIPENDETWSVGFLYKIEYMIIIKKNANLILPLINKKYNILMMVESEDNQVFVGILMIVVFSSPSVAMYALIVLKNTLNIM